MDSPKSRSAQLPPSPSYVGSIAGGTITLYSVPTPNSGPWGITAKGPMAIFGSRRLEVERLLG